MTVHAYRDQRTPVCIEEEFYKLRHTVSMLLIINACGGFLRECFSLRNLLYLPDISLNACFMCCILSVGSQLVPRTLIYVLKT